MRPLYEIDADILSCVDEETGEILDIDRLDQLEMEREQKIEGVILWRKDIEAEKAAVQEEVRKLQARVKSLDNQAESLKKYIGWALSGEKFKTARCSVSYRSTKSIVIDDISKIPANYFKPADENWISKSMIKDAIEQGIEVAGAHQEERQSIIIK